MPLSLFSFNSPFIKYSENIPSEFRRAAFRTLKWPPGWDGGWGVFSHSTQDVMTDGTRSGRTRLEYGGSPGGYLYQTFCASGQVGVTNSWQKLDWFLDNPGDWEQDTYNRMRVFVKHPVGTTEEEDNGIGQMHIAGFLARPDTNNHEDQLPDGRHGHPYHYFKHLEHSVWVQMIVDWNPHHYRESPAIEHGPLQYPYEGDFPTSNYFDCISDFYLEHKSPQWDGDEGNMPALAYVDNIDLWQDPYPEDTLNMYSLHGCYVEFEDRYRIGYSTPKDEIPHITRDVVYAFENIHVLGFDNATPIGTMITPDEGVFNNAMGDFTGIDSSGEDYVYFGIRKQGETNFRQIIIPTTDGDVPPILE